jgi:hypothetical protein
MRAILMLLIALPSIRVTVAHSQLDYYARLGVTAATTLVTDDLIQEIETSQDIAPTLSVGAALPIAPTYSAGLEAALSSSGYSSREQDVNSDLGTLRTGSILLHLTGPVWHRPAELLAGGRPGHLFAGRDYPVPRRRRDGLPAGAVERVGPHGFAAV